MTKLRKRQSPDLCVERCTPRWLASLFGRQAVRWSIKNEDIKEQLADFKKAELWADTLLDEHWNDKFPVDPNVIAVNMGMEVWLAPTSGEFAGVILKTDKQEMPSIFVDKDATTSRKRLTIAHMVGHYVEHSETRNPQTSKYLAILDFMMNQWLAMRQFLQTVGLPTRGRLTNLSENSLQTTSPALC